MHGQTEGRQLCISQRKEGITKAVKTLLGLGADQKLEDQDGNTPLGLALAKDLAQGGDPRYQMVTSALKGKGEL